VHLYQDIESNAAPGAPLCSLQNISELPCVLFVSKVKKGEKEDSSVLVPLKSKQKTNTAILLV